MSFCLNSYSQEGGIRVLKMKSEKIIHSDIIGDNNVLIRIDSNGREHKLKLDNATIFIENDTLKGSTQYTLPTATTTTLGGVKIDGTTIAISNGVISSIGTGWDNSYQSLSGTTINYNVSNGINAIMTMSGDVTINMSNVQVGMVGNISIINDAAIRTLTFTGYTFNISLAIRNATNSVYTSGNNQYDKFTWDYDGVRFTITGEYNLQ